MYHRRMHFDVIGVVIQKVFHPDFERKQLPDLHRPILCSVSVLPDKRPHRAGLEDPPFAQSLVGEQIIHHGAQFVCQPVVHWRTEACFRLLQDFGWKQIRNCLTEDVLGYRSNPTTQFQLRRHIPRDELGQFVVQERYAHFQRRRHAHLIGIRKIQACHKDLRIQIEHLVQKICVPNLAKALAVCLEWISAIYFC